MPWRQLAGRIASMVTRGKVAAAVVGPRTLLQVTGLDGESFDEVELLLPPGYVSLPPAESDVVMLQANGSRDHKVAIGGDQVGNLAGAQLQPGEAGIRASGRQIVCRVAAIQLGADGEPQRFLVTDQFMALFNGHTHNGGPPPDQKMMPAHLTKSTTIGGAS